MDAVLKWKSGAGGVESPLLSLCSWSEMEGGDQCLPGEGFGQGGCRRAWDVLPGLPFSKGGGNAGGEINPKILFGVGRRGGLSVCPRVWGWRWKPGASWGYDGVSPRGVP